VPVKPERDKDFEQHLHQLMMLLKKMIKNLPCHADFSGALGAGSPLGKPNAANMNVFLFNFLPLLPVSPEEMNDLEGLLEEYLPVDEKEPGLSTELNLSDLEFLRKNGIRF
jgi:hypothetical protein